MKLRATGILLLFASLMTLSALVRAHPPEGGAGMMMGDTNPRQMGMMRGSMMDMMMGPGASGQMGMMGESMMGESMMGRMSIGRILRLPDLTDEQRQALVERHRKLQRQLLSLEEKALEARFALQDATSADTPDPQTVGRALQGVFDVRRQMVEATIAAHNDVRDVLTEEQLEALKAPGGGMGMHGMGGMRSRMSQQP